MRSGEDVLIPLISSAIRGKRDLDLCFHETDWEEVFDIAKKHDIIPLLYDSIKLYHIENIIDKKLFEEIKVYTARHALFQKQNISRISTVLDAFNKAGIPVIALKGVALRNLYPRPEYRTMCDADILVHKSDFEAAKKLLLGMGYCDSGHDDPKHVRFSQKPYLSIELHWSPLNPNKYRTQIDAYEKGLWRDSVTFEVNGVSTSTLGPEDQVLYVCLHIAKHYFVSGFGIRQLCDMVLLVETEGHKIDWSNFCRRLEAFDITKFVLVLFLVCNKLFDMKIPEDLLGHMKFNNSNVEIFIEDILSGGTFGYNAKERFISNRFMSYIDIEGKDNLKNRIKRLLTFLFPSPKKMGARYKYAEKCFLFLPVAWLHRFLYNLVRKDRNDIVKSLSVKSVNKSPFEIFRKRSKIILWLKNK